MASTTSSGHIRKRQYQPSITSFFNTRNAENNWERLRSTTSSLSPPLPAETQASLLSVGMRVRKSVPEGYKTHKTIPAQGFPFPSTAPSTTPTRSVSGAGTRRELMPFCGLHKIGGWAAQSDPPSSAPAVMDHDDESVPALIWSQNALASTQGSFASTSTMQSTPSRKRGYEEEVEDDMDAYFEEMEAADEAQQRTLPNTRPVAKMKGTAAHELVRVVGADDFEEACFLEPVDGMELDCR